MKKDYGDFVRHGFTVSEFLSWTATELREWSHGSPVPPTCANVLPEIDLLLAVMDAVRELPGLDTSPDAPSTFDRDIDRAVAAYREQRDAAFPLLGR